MREAPDPKLEADLGNRGLAGDSVHCVKSTPCGAGATTGQRGRKRQPPIRFSSYPARSVAVATKRGRRKKVTARPRRQRRIQREPGDHARNYYVVDANFLANKFIPASCAPAGLQQNRIDACDAWWKEIDAQLKSRHARVYVPDVCIAEAFKVLAKKYYRDKWFRFPAQHKQARDRMSRTLTVTAKTLRAKEREIRYHDVETNRDIIIAVDRFYEVINKAKQAPKKKPGQTTPPKPRNVEVSVPDLLILSSAKYLMDFYDIPRERLHIVTLDRGLRTATQSIQELPNTYDPTLAADAAAKIFA